MKNYIKTAAVVLTLVLQTSVSSRAAEPASQMPDWIKNHLEIGTRTTYFQLQDHHRDFLGGDRFYGSINELEIQQIYLPLKVFVAYKVNPYWGVELTAEKLSVETWSRPDPQDGYPWTDGTINLMGPVFSVFARYPNATGFTPYAGVGVAYFFADFDADPAWHHPADKIDYDPSFYQDFKLDNTLAWLGYVGLLINLDDNWALDFMARYMAMDVDGVTLTRHGGSDYYENGTFTFPMKNISYGVGLRYMF